MLKSLQKNGYTLVSPTNGTKELTIEQLMHSGLDIYFEQIFTFEEVKTYKPHFFTYEFICNSLNFSIKESTMIACQAWDITDAQRAGLTGCFINRPGMVWYSLERVPDFSFRMLIDFAQIIEGKLLQPATKLKGKGPA